MARTAAARKTAEPSYEELKAKLAELEKNGNGNGTVEFRISEKGCVSVYGLGWRFPVSMYFENWIRLLDNADRLRKFLMENKSRLKLRAT